MQRSKKSVTPRPATRGSVTIHDEYVVVRGSSGNTCRDRQRRTHVILRIVPRQLSMPNARLALHIVIMMTSIGIRLTMVKVTVSNKYNNNKNKNRSKMFQKEKITAAPHVRGMVSLVALFTR
jgi:hypothetical protein